MKLLGHTYLILPLLLITLAPAARAQTIPNPSFEANGPFKTNNGYAASNGGVITGWTMSNPNAIGLNTNGQPFADNGAIPDGVNVAFLQSSGGTLTALTNTITGLTAGNTYQVTFRANMRAATSAPRPRILFNNGAFALFSANPPVGGSTAYYTINAFFTATNTSANLVVANSTASDTTLLVDDFSVALTTVSNALRVTVTNAGGLGSLQQAIVNAAAVSGTNKMITFDSSLAGQTIPVTNALVLGNNLTLDGSSLAGGMTVSGSNATRIFNVLGTNVNLVALNLIAGHDHVIAGAISNSGALTLTQCTVAGNFVDNVDPLASAIYSLGQLTMNKCTVYSNGVNSIFIDTSGAASLTQCTLAANGVNDTNIAGTYRFTFLSSGTSVLLHCTISSNLTAMGTVAYLGSGSVIATNCVLTGNSNDSYNVTLTTFRCLTSGNPLLAPLGNYGGPTLTMPPLPGSPAIDYGNREVVSNANLTTDQRGYPMPIGAMAGGFTLGKPDAGAVEGVYNPAGPGVIQNFTRARNAPANFSFTNSPDMGFYVLASTNLTLPVAQWTNLGFISEATTNSGFYQFADPQATNYPVRFYRVRQQ